MNANEITNERLLEISSFYGSNEVGLLARAELDRRKAEEAKPEPAHSPDCAVAVNARHECSCGAEIEPLTVTVVWPWGTLEQVAVKDKINELIAAVNWLAKEGKK